MKSGLPARNGEGGPAGAALVYAEELLVLALDEPSTGAVEEANGKKAGPGKKPDMELLVLRWDGTCASLKASEAVPYLPGTSKHAFVDWTKLDLSVQRSLSRESEIRRAVEARDAACRAGGSPECQSAEEKLSNTIVSHIRRGTKLSMPEQRPS